ncbi:MAG: polysaccharide deacetylase family protein [Acidobacteria bacterium]|nr:polysaccharide deacetylase family protein [Acidobacteriota bacterium]
MRRRAFLAAVPAAALAAKRPPDATVVLTFDDAVKSHRTFVGPYLKDLGFPATFFVTHRWMEDTANFMSWSDIAELHGMGFEIGNHTWTHANFASAQAAAKLAAELDQVEAELEKVKVPKPTCFAWPGNNFGKAALAVLQQRGFRLARRGGAPEVAYGKVLVGPVFDPGRHHPLLIPTTHDSYPNGTLENFRNAVAQARDGKITVLQFHGVPDTAHPWVHTPPELFRQYMDHLKQQKCTVLALKDVAQFYDLSNLPADPLLNR